MHCFHLFSLFKYCKRVLLRLSLSALMGKKNICFLFLSRGHCFTVSCCGSDLHPFSIYSLHSFFIVYFSFFQKASLRKPANIKRRLSCTHCQDHETTKLSPQKPLVYFELLPAFFLKIYILRPYVKALLTLESFTPVKSIA